MMKIWISSSIYIPSYYRRFWGTFQAQSNPQNATFSMKKEHRLLYNEKTG